MFLKNEPIIKLESFEKRRYEPTVWRGGAGTGDEIDYIESTEFRCPRAVKKHKPKPKKVFTGKVTLLRETYGFITDRNRKRWFFPFSEVVGDRIEAEGIRVTFEISEEVGRTKAINVKEL
jgi:cold shock CspA family protein